MRRNIHTITLVVFLLTALAYFVKMLFIINNSFCQCILLIILVIEILWLLLVHWARRYIHTVLWKQQKYKRKERHAVKAFFFLQLFLFQKLNLMVKILIDIWENRNLF